MIEDFFMTNDSEITIQAGSVVSLLGPFCIEADTVFDFNLQASFDLEVDSIMVTLLLNENIVAQSQVNDMQAPSSLSLLYRSRITEQTEVMVAVTTMDAETSEV